MTVKLHYVAYQKENVIKTFTEISHKEKKPVALHKYASAMLHLNRSKYFLTEFSGDWASETHITSQQLQFGKKIIDTKLGTRANMFCSPFFQLSPDAPAAEESGEVLVGTLGWTGNFRFVFEVDNENALRIIPSINPYASAYSLPANEVFVTPEFYFTLSFNGMGQASRNLHDWARNHQVKDGRGDRMTLLNNWEATGFNFNEEKLEKCMDEAAGLGVDMFLLDDGWFANKYPRSSDRQGLGDWQETADKLPNGIGHLTAVAKEKGVKFGLWIEPEMVNPKSELYEKHKDWVIHLPNRDEYHYRHQLVLDLSNPRVQDYVFGIVDGLMTKYPDIAFFKWDCNSPITNIYSPYLKDKQSHLYIDYVRGLYNVLQRISAKYPALPMMLCSGGGGRCDYEALKYFTEFWPSDNTDLKPVILDGDMHCLVSPYSGNHTSTMYVNKEKSRAVVFSFDIYPRYAEHTQPVRLHGLDADRMYRVREIGLMPGTKSNLSGNDRVYSGEYLQNVGLNLFTGRQLNSRVVELTAE